jgi:hypothetical protein
MRSATTRLPRLADCAVASEAARCRATRRLQGLRPAVGHTGMPRGQIALGLRATRTRQVRARPLRPRDPEEERQTPMTTKPSAAVLRDAKLMAWGYANHDLCPITITATWRALHPAVRRRWLTAAKRARAMTRKGAGRHWQGGSVRPGAVGRCPQTPGAAGTGGGCGEGGCRGGH